MSKGWVGFDLDGTLAVYDGWKGATHVGEPVPNMIDQVKRLLKRHVTVKIFTARVWFGQPGDHKTWDEFWRRESEALQAREAIEKWCLEHLGTVLPITCEKDFGMVALFDDRCVQVRKNTGEILGDPLEVLGTEL